MSHKDFLHNAFSEQTLELAHRSFKRSAHGIILSDHLKSLSIAHSDFSAPTQLNVPLVGLVKQ